MSNLILILILFILSLSTLFTMNEYASLHIFFGSILFFPICVFIVRSFIFSRFFSSFKDRVFCFIPVFQFYFFSKNLVDKNQKFMESRFSTLIGSFFSFSFYLFFLVGLIWPYIVFCYKVLYVDSFFDEIALFFICKIVRFIFNLAYLGVLKTIFWNTGSKNKFVSFLITFSTLFFSEILSLILVYSCYIKTQKGLFKLDNNKGAIAKI